MRDVKRPADMSQLDYLWQNFGGFIVGTGYSDEPNERALVTEQTLSDFAAKV